MIGQSIANFKILEKLGEGGMGIVYKALDTKLDRFVALKFLPELLTRQTEGRQAANDAEKARFLQEAKAASALNHPNVCTIYGIEEFEGRQFIEMEYVDGVTLRQKISDRPAPAADAITYALHIGEALAEAHAKGIVHRDIKCDNIMLTGKGQIKVMDFGLAKLKGSLKLTRTSSTVGTLAYMAPEQIQGGEVGARSDIFSFGIVLFELLTGRTPFKGEHEAAMMYSILNEQPEQIGKYRPEVSPDLQRIVTRSLEKDPEDRYQSVADMVSELRKVGKQSAKVTRPIPVNAVDVPHDGPQPSVAAPAVQYTSTSTSAAKRTNRPLVVSIGVIVLAIIGIIAYKFFLPGNTSLDSLAVLPFVNANADPSTEYLTDGMTESIINSLTRIPQLRVVPRSTVFRFKGKDVDPQEIGTKLSVHAILSGRVVQRGDELNVQLDLIDVRNQSQIWGEQYRRKLNDVITLQDEIVTDVSRELRVALSGETKQELTKRATENTNAYKLYLQGRYFWQKRKGSEIRKAIEYFNQAIALDPDFALAYAGLADSYLLLEQYAGQPWKETAPLAEHAARKALEIDRSLGEAHASLGFIRMEEWDWEGAEKEFKTAIELSPKYPTAYHWYGIFLGRQSRKEESFNAIQKAYELDPLAPIILLNLGIGYDRHKDDMKSSMESFQKSLDLDANFAPAYHQMGRVQTRRGMLKEALANLQKGVELTGRASENLSATGYCLGLMGRKEEAMAMVRELEELYARHNAAAYNIARIYAGLHEKEKVFEWLNRDYADHSGWIAWLKYDFEWNDYHDDPRFVELLKKIGLGS